MDKNPAEAETTLKCKHKVKRYHQISDIGMSRKPGKSKSIWVIREIKLSTIFI